MSGVETLQRFLRDGRDRAWNAWEASADWRVLAVALDKVITGALDNEAGWTCNQDAPDEPRAEGGILVQPIRVHAGRRSAARGPTRMSEAHRDIKDKLRAERDELRARLQQHEQTDSKEETNG